MLEESSANAAIEAQAREEKPVTTTVFDTLNYAFEIFGKNEDLQFQKNLTNTVALATVMWRGKVLLNDIPCDELLGLEARLVHIRELFVAVPTLDATRHWVPDANTGFHVWATEFPDETTKTEKKMEPVIMHAPTKEHPAQVAPVTKDVVVGRFTTIRRSGAATAFQKANAIKLVDELLVEIKQARQRANQTDVNVGKVSHVLIPLLLSAFEEG